MPRFVCQLAVVLVAVFAVAPSGAHALDRTDPQVRIGISGGLLGTLPVGRDVSPGGTYDEFQKGLWVQIEPVQVDIGAHLQLSALFRVSVAGGYNEHLLQDNLESTYMPSLPQSKLTLLGLGARVFPLGDGLFRPFVSLGAGYATAGARYTAISQRALQEAAATAQWLAENGLTAPEQAPLTCASQGVCVQRSHRHRGLGLALGVGVRVDPTVTLFGEPWRLPLTLELSYTKNVWLGLDHDEAYEVSGSDELSGARPNVDFLGLLVTAGFLR